MIEVSYDTAANPAPAATVNHLVMFDPANLDAVVLTDCAMATVVEGC